MRFVIILLLAVLSLNSYGQSSPDTTTTGLPYWDSTISHKGSEGYIDTFSVAGNKFRIIHHDTLYDGIVQKNINNKWQTIIEFENLGNHNDYHIDIDVNGDGYMDIIYERRWSSQAYLYNKEINSFDADYIALESEWVLLDTARNIYCEDEYIKDNHIGSELYTFKGNKRIPLYVLIFEKKADTSGEEKMIKMKLYKYVNTIQGKVLIKTVLLDVDSFEFKFDYVEYWKKQYKKLLGYK